MVIGMNNIQNYVEAVLQPKLQGDGGWIEFVSFSGNELTVVYRGECSKTKGRLNIKRAFAGVGNPINESV